MDGGIRLNFPPVDEDEPLHVAGRLPQTLTGHRQVLVAPKPQHNRHTGGLLIIATMTDVLHSCATCTI